MFYNYNNKLLVKWVKVHNRCFFIFFILALKLLNFQNK